MLHVEFFGFAKQSVFGLTARKWMGSIPECALSTCLIWCFLSLKLGTP